MKLSAKSLALLQYLQENDGEAVVTDELATVLGCAQPLKRSYIPNATDLKKKGLAEYIKGVEVAGHEGPVSVMKLTEAGFNFVQEEDAE